MANRKMDVMGGLKVYSIPLVLGTVSLVALFFAFDQNAQIEKLTEDVAIMESLLEDTDAVDSGLDTEFDKEAHVELIEGRTVSAEAIGKEMIAVDDALTEFYKTNEPFPSDQGEVDKMLAARDAAHAENTRLTGAGDANQLDTWKLNPAWETTLESVVVYQDTPRVPIVFSMATESGDNAGLIYAIYDTASETLTNISKHYTTAGMQDAVDIGGI